jgi:hypothetical protein
MPQKSVRVLLRGGLGNQLFQYGAGFALSKKLGVDLILDPSLLPKRESTGSRVSTWPVQLGQFNHFGSIVQGNSNRTGASRLRAGLMQLDRSIGDRIPSPLAKLGRFSNEANAQIEHFLALQSKKSVINSYSNSSEYFLDYGDEIRSSIRELRNPSINFQELTQEAAEEKPLAVHVRLGDYTRLRDIYGSFDPEYLREAIRLQLDLSGDRPIWLFSDDVQMALDLTGDLGISLEVKPKLTSMSSLETMLVISRCLGLVASNSSFSWWAAYLSELGESKAIFPRPFFAPGGPDEPKNWLLPSWLQIGRSL